MAEAPAYDHRVSCRTVSCRTVMDDQMAESNPTHEVEVNFFYLHYHDAQKLTEWAEAEGTKLRSLYARHALLAVVFATEALANRLLNQLPLSKVAAVGIERLGIREKWSLIPFLLTGRPEAREWFDASKEPFQSFAELVQIRNWLAHPKSGEYVAAIYDGRSTISVFDEDFDPETERVVPWIETLKGGHWKQTRIPLNPFEWTAQHARVATKVLDSIVEELKEVLGGILTDEWLWEIDLKSKADGKVSRITIDSLWGGYTPSVD